MTIVWIACIIFVAGCVGGLLNAFFPGQELVFPRIQRVGGRRVLRPGAIGNMAVGGVAALVLWGLYGPHAEITVLTDGSGEPAPHITLRLGQIFAALMTGLAGGRILTTEAEKIPSLEVSQDTLRQSLGKAVAIVSSHEDGEKS
jgi:hypothetical protein